MYHLPLLPGYGPSSNIRSSAAPTARIARLDEAEERGYQGAYFDAPASAPADGYIPSSPTDARQDDVRHLHGYIPSSPIDARHDDDRQLGGYSPSSPNDARHEDDRQLHQATIDETEDEHDPDHDHDHDHDIKRRDHAEEALLSPTDDVKVPVPAEPEAEAMFFPYGVVVFFGLTEANERAMLEDVFLAGAAVHPLSEENWETEECHYSVCSVIVAFNSH